jgi:hypothetical protein
MNARFAACLATATLLLIGCNTTPPPVANGARPAGATSTTELERTLEQLLLPDGCAIRHTRALSSTDAFVALLLPATTSATVPCAAPNSKGP